MRIAIVADTHADESSPRWEEHKRVMRWIIDDVCTHGVDLILHAGDVYERRSTPAEREFTTAWFQAAAAIVPVVVVAGNHDAPLDVELLGRLETSEGVRALERPAAFIETSPMGPEGVIVQCLPWPRKGALLAASGRALSSSEGGAIASDLLRDVLRGLAAQADAIDPERKLPRILLAHAMVRGSETSTGQPLVGCDFELGLEDLALAGADFYALGHIHRGQAWDIAGAPVVYPGSPFRTAFGEVEPKGYVLLEIEAGKAPTWEVIETPATKMVLIEADYDLGGWTADAEDVAGAEVRFRYHVTPHEREAARAWAQTYATNWLEGGAISVKLEERVEALQTTRASAVLAAPTLADKAKALWKAQGRSVDAETEADALLLINAIDEETRAA